MPESQIAQSPQSQPRSPSDLLLEQLRTQPSSFFQEKWLFWLLGIAFVAVMATTILRFFTPAATGPTSEFNTYQGVTPGKSKLADVTSKLGQPIDTKAADDGKQLSYSSIYPQKPHQVIVDATETVRFIKEELDYKNPPIVATEQEKLGPPDLVLFEPKIGEAVRAYVFLDDGVVLMAHIANGAVEQRWYFEPMDKTTFLKTWGSELETQGEGPEHLPVE